MTALRRRTTSVAVVLSAALLATACSGTDAEPAAGPSADDATTASSDAFPVTIEHALGSTTIEEEPQRVVTWGWGTADAVIALGVTPVAIPTQSYGGDDEGVLPWIREALEEAGEEIPTVLPDTGDDVPFEEIAEAEPDVILAPYSGITAEQYRTLSAFAPVVAYPDQPWATPWRDVVTITGEALGRSDEAEAVLTDIDAQVAEQRDAHPEFEGLTLAATWEQGGVFYVYADEDPRVEFMLDLGFVNAPAVDTLDTDESPFYFTLSTERLSELTSDVLVAYGTTEEELAAFLAAPYAQVMPQVTQGAVAEVVGEEFIAAVSPPTALSLPWGLDDVVAELEEAVAARGA
ncbi:iron-siderophore ABC transporter substrate-binding protein [Cellulomonas sp. ATA003]|uniref:iron-siderophore ABC transporter substrate-binding protein n=1 Tax=Cellulomonas sp. ATA003 TaxID=3073064 RepID=UPI002873016E|nr:iron-siderophore ABC transporter substrate-binding protein [Cellulomonas sp. ATA003]WNB84543.1 iron-siderophore ABC transporter substrate-binding protein [Cellulomonas sp. ATA003]